MFDMSLLPYHNKRIEKIKYVFQMCIIDIRKKKIFF